MSAVFTDDLRAVVDSGCLVKRRNIPVVALGFSLGGVVLSKFVGEIGKENVASPLAGAITVCSPWDMHNASYTMQQPLQWAIYQKPLTRGLLSYVNRHQNVLAKLPGIDFKSLLERNMLAMISSVQEFDRYIIAPHFNFSSVCDYYSAADSLPWLEHSKIPVLCVGTANDPITGSLPSLRQWEMLAQRNSNFVYLLFPCGGHLGFLGTPLRTLLRKNDTFHSVIVESARALCENATP
jgi:predicted alpha/beta-fold hydrolase